jgi:aerobic carbon-monoxide dehydrogenase large subunit
MSILGNRVPRSEDPRFITGTATFGDDVDLPGAVHVTFVRSLSPHARIRSIDVSAVSSIPGAQAFTSASIPDSEGAAGADIDLPTLPQAMPGLNEQMIRPVIASDVVRYAGEIVAVVVTEDRLKGPDAAELVVADLEDLDPVADPRTAAEDGTLLFPEAGTNVCAAFP